MQNRDHELEISGTAKPVEETNTSEEESRLNKAVFFLLCTMLIFSTLAYGAVETWAFGFLSILAGATAVLWLADSLFKKEFRFDTNLLQIPLAGLILVGLIQLLPLRSPEIAEGALSIPAVSSLSLNPYATRMAVIQLCVQFVFFSAAFVFLNTAPRIKKISVIVIIFASAMAFFGILQWLANPQGIYGWRPTPQAIPFASFVNQHHFAAFMEMTIGLTLALLIGKATHKNKRLLLIIAVVLMGIAIILTGSRGGLLSLLGVIGFVFTASFLHKDSADDEDRGKRTAFRRKWIFIGGGLALILLLFSASLMLGGDASLLRGIGLTNQTDVSSGRTHFWSVAWQVFKDYPILGAGLDSFATVFPQYDTWNGNFRVEQAHNDYLQILADAGIIGFLCVAAFIYLLFKQSRAVVVTEQSNFRRSMTVGALAGCFGILIHSFFDFPLRTPSNAFFFLLFAVLATAPVVFTKRRRRK